MLKLPEKRKYSHTVLSSDLFRVKLGKIMMDNGRNAIFGVTVAKSVLFRNTFVLIAP